MGILNLILAAVSSGRGVSVRSEKARARGSAEVEPDWVVARFGRGPALKCLPKRPLKSLGPSD